MQARIENPVLTFRKVVPALTRLRASVDDAGLPETTRYLVELRASQINGCGVCAVQHPRIAKRLGETDDRLFAVAAWRDAPYFTPAERAALALTEAATRLSDRSDPVPDELWDEAARHYIASINAWNRLNVVTRQVAGQAW